MIISEGLFFDNRENLLQLFANLCYNLFMRSKVFLFSIITFISAAAIFGVAFYFFRLKMTNPTEEKEEEYNRYYAMICDDCRSSFWQKVYQGAAAAAEKSGSYVELFGSNLSYDYSTEELMEIAVSSSVDGIMVLGNGEDEMTGLINRAESAGIPVVTMYTDNAMSERKSFVGVSAFNIGNEYGRLILNAINEKKRLLRESGEADDGTVSVTVFFDEKRLLFDQSVILSGINDTLSREAPEESFSLKTVSVDDSTPFSVEECMRDLFMEKEVPDVMVCLSELDTTCAYQAAIDYNMVGRVYILGYYDSLKILNAISRNVVYSSLAVDTEELGAYCVEALDEYIASGYTSQYFSADVTIIDRFNVAEFLKKEEETDEE